MRKRRLRPEELELWQQVARSAERLPGQKPAPEPDEAASRRRRANRRRPETPCPPSISEAEPSRRPSITISSGTTSDRLSRDPVRMDAKSFTRMKRGKLVPESRIDLHGMTIDQAHPELIRFILTSQTRGLRLVLVITGKGLREDPHDPMPRRRGVLKTQVPQWLRLPPVAQAVLQVSEAHGKHGGSGAYYVYLRKRR